MLVDKVKLIPSLIFIYTCPKRKGDHDLKESNFFELFKVYVKVYIVLVI